MVKDFPMLRSGCMQSRPWQQHWRCTAFVQIGVQFKRDEKKKGREISLLSAPEPNPTQTRVEWASNWALVRSRVVV